MTAGFPSSGRAPMRVLYLARAPFISGAERALLSMLRHLDRTRVAPAVVLGHDTELAGLVRELDVPVTISAMPQRSWGRAWGWWRSLSRLERVLADFRADLMHANDVPSCQAMSVVGKRRDIPRVVHVRWGIAAADAGWWARAGAEGLICISRWTQETLGPTAGTSLAEARVEVVPDAVDWPALDEPAPAAAPAGEPVLGFAGQLVPIKGLDLVIQALARLPADRRPRLRVAGVDTATGGAYQRELEALARRCGVDGRIEWLGFVRDMAGFYRGLRAVVCPSRIEPLGLVPLEAARFGVPALASRVGGLAETIEHGVTGWLAEPTVDAWAQAIPQALDREACTRLGLAAHRRTRELYSPAVYQARLMRMYEELL